MNEAEVQKQLDRMKQFIIGEAETKAEELRQLAEEEFSIEKSRIKQEGKMRLKAEYDRKEKQVAVQKRIEKSNRLNRNRLSMLKSRQDSIGEIIEEAKRRLVDISTGPEYSDFLRKAIVQSLIKLNEPSAEVRCREQDVGAVRSVLSAALDEYKSKTSRECTVTIDEKHFLAPAPSDGHVGASCAGGVVLAAREGRILCDNTLDQRLDLAFEAMLPQVRLTLFGASESRKYFSA